jgi:hypothetical protein
MSNSKRTSAAHARMGEGRVGEEVRESKPEEEAAIDGTMERCPCGRDRCQFEEGGKGESKVATGFSKAEFRCKMN